jgi:hypothetical protein
MEYVMKELKNGHFAWTLSLFLTVLAISLKLVFADFHEFRQMPRFPFMISCIFVYFHCRLSKSVSKNLSQYALPQ